MLVSAFVAFLAGQAALGSHGTTLAAPHAVRAVVGVALYLTVVGAARRRARLRCCATPRAAIATLFGLLLVLPGLGRLLPDTWQPHVLPYLPSNAGGSVFAVQPEAGMLGVWTGFAVFCAWAAAALVLGALVLKRRDA